MKRSASFAFGDQRSTFRMRGAVAHLGERRLCKAEVGGSSPPSSTKLDKIKNLHIEIQASSLTWTLG